MKQHALRAFCLAGLLLGLPHLIFAAVPSPPPDQNAAEDKMVPSDLADRRNPAALAELKRATVFLASLPRFHVKSSLAYDVIQADGRPLQFEKSGHLYLQRPNRFFADIQFDDGRRRRIWYDGKILSLAEQSKNIYTRIKTPPTIDATLDMMEGLFKEPQPLADLLYSDLSPLDHLALEADVVGNSRVLGRPCTHLSFRGKTVDWQLWVEQGPNPFIRKLVISYREKFGSPRCVAILDAWETPDRFKDNLFKFTAPADAQWIDVLIPMPRRIEKGDQP